MPSRRWFSNHSRPPPNFRSTFGTTMLSEANRMHEVSNMRNSRNFLCGGLLASAARVKCTNITTAPGTEWEKNRDLSC
eukprot:scaffold18559_cov124-Skeletonema_dohrnii-CCMP3373.AAC.1